MESEENDGQVLFSRSEIGNETELTHSEIWDDQLLIQHYDDTMDKARRLLVHRLSSASSVTDSDCSNSHRTELINGFSHGKLHNSSSTGIKKKKKKKGRKKNEWHTGDPCRARYSEDQHIYEATIIGINNAAGTCTVRYLGYNNHEDVAQSSLLKSKGEGLRRKQLKEVAEAYDQSNESTEDSAAIESESASEGQKHTRKHPRTSHSTAGRNMMPPPNSAPSSSFPRVSGMSIPHLPDLPPPPALGLVEGPDSISSEALHTMLMSWYMTGYHTGYYQGLKQGKNLGVDKKTPKSSSRNN